MANQKFEEIDVERINIIEPDGTLRLTLANNARNPELPQLQGTKHDRTGTRGAGMLFFDDDGGEIGGISYSGRPGAGSSSLTFDRFGQDQSLMLQYGEYESQSGAALTFIERPATPLAEYVDAFLTASAIEDEAERAEATAAFAEGHTWRMSVGFEKGKEAGLNIADTKGRVRIKLFVDADDEPHLQFLDADGNVTFSLPPS